MLPSELPNVSGEMCYKLKKSFVRTFPGNAKAHRPHPQMDMICGLSFVDAHSVPGSYDIFLFIADFYHRSLSPFFIVTFFIVTFHQMKQEHLQTIEYLQRVNCGDQRLGVSL